MALPAPLTDTSERIPFDNMSGWTHGRFSAGEYVGGYERGLDRLTVGDLFQRTDGHAEFTIAGPGISTTIEGYCSVRKRALAFDDIEFRPRPMAYRCDLEADGRAIPARLEVQEDRRGLENALTRNARRGEIGLAGEIVSFRLVHSLAGSSWPVEDSIGYVFEQDGRAIGALELNGKPVLILPQGTEIGKRRAMMVAAVALATFWDPATI
ncbi:hypothetical protein [Aurantiacibacter hainanensis]|uniref:hypothetical protein n=1 Tax=Aurantiacibacter hainanensis TaxID=3076114 RepID=UPI0030C6D66C